MELKIIDWNAADEPTRAKLTRRSELNVDEIMPAVRDICAAVEKRGDDALREFSAKFDKLEAPDLPICLTRDEIGKSIDSLDSDVRDSLDFVMANVRAAHEHQRPESLVLTETRPGVYAGEKTTPIPAVGIYIPRGRGNFPSMLYMLAVPASIAGVPNLSLATPPSPDGSLDAASLYVARECGIDRIYRIGGAQAMAALAFGTESVSRVDKIIGPGSAYIAAAKRVLRDRVDVGLPAGPSESMIIADDDDDPRTVTLDLLIEAEHGSDSQALLVTPSRRLASAVADLIPALVADTPEPRRSFLESVFGSYGAAVIVRDVGQAVDVAEEIAPEHLQIRTRDPWTIAGRISAAAEILIGPHSAFSLANYAAGANAVLPTGGTARVWSGGSVYDFVKRTSVVQVTETGFSQLAPHAARLAEYEKFYWHARALLSRESDS